MAGFCTFADGLAASVFTKNESRGYKIAQSIDTGMCHVNGVRFSVVSLLVVSELTRIFVYSCSSFIFFVFRFLDDSSPT